MSGKLKETTNNVIVPSVVMLALIALAGKALGMLPGLSGSDGLSNRLTAVEARQVEMERQYREDRSEQMMVLMELKSAVARIEGKLEK